MAAGAAAGGTGFTWTRRHVLALAVLCLAALLDTIDVTVVNVAMPAIRNSLHFSEGGLAWMVDAYMVPFGGFLLLGGRTGDLLGRRRVLLAGTGVFSLASLGSAVAPSAGVMIVTRAAEGIAAAFVVPMTLAMLSSVFPAGPARNRAFAVWGGVSAAAGTLGLAVISAVVASSTARSAAAGHAAPAALTAGFHAGFTVSAVLVAVTIVTAAALLRDEGRGERLNLVELQAGH
jgi:MFS family permease